MSIDTADLERSGKETTEMFALNAGVWPVNREDPAEVRDRDHRIALNEARIASEGRDDGFERSSSRSLIDRVRLAVGRAPTEPACAACPA